MKLRCPNGHEPPHFAVWLNGELAPGEPETFSVGAVLVDPDGRATDKWFGAPGKVPYEWRMAAEANEDETACCTVCGSPARIDRSESPHAQLRLDCQLYVLVKNYLHDRKARAEERALDEMWRRLHKAQRRLWIAERQEKEANQ